MPDFKDHAIVDRAVGYVGGNATLFVYDEASNQFVRRSTNVKKENGDRAVGTQLAPDHPGQAVLRRGEAYKGQATLFGKSFMTAYYPVANPAGKVVGVLYVGIPMAQFDAHAGACDSDHGDRRRGCRPSGDDPDTLLIVGRVTKPLRSVTANADGDCQRQHRRRGRNTTSEWTKSARSREPSRYSRHNVAERRRLRDEQTAAAGGFRRTAQDRIAGLRRRIRSRGRRHHRQGDDLVRRV